MQSSRDSRLSVITSTRPAAPEEAERRSTRAAALDGFAKQRKRCIRFATSLGPIEASCSCYKNSIVLAAYFQLISNQLTSNELDTTESQETC